MTFTDRFFMDKFRKKYVRFNDQDIEIMHLKLEHPKVKKYSKSVMIVAGFLVLTTIISVLIAYGKSSKLGMGTFTSINRIDGWSVPANFSVSKKSSPLIKRDWLFMRI